MPATLFAPGFGPIRQPSGGAIIDTNDERPPTLSLAWDMGAMQTELAGVRIAPAPTDLPPFDIDAVVVEQDTARVLDDADVLLEPDESYAQLVREMGTEPRLAPGSVVVRPGRPLRLEAIVQDFDLEPCCREEWIVSALDGVFREAADRRIGALALPALGSRHGGFDRRRFLVLLRERLQAGAPPGLRRLWLVVPAGAVAGVLRILRGEG